MNISKEQFVILVNEYQKTRDEYNKILNVLNGESVVLSNWIDRYQRAIEIAVGTYDPTRTEEDDLDYFIWDLDCGRKYYPGCYRIDGENIDISTPEKFYDAMIKLENDLLGREETNLTF